MQHYNKSWVALLGVLVEGALFVWGEKIGIGEEALPAVLTGITALTGLGVYRVPNAGHGQALQGREPGHG